jgi:glyoxylase-like metal-dependent hydrolase (beta-lactamase superfamily II)
MNMTDPIRRVSVVSTGQVQIRPDHLASTWRPTAWWLLASRRWTGPRPINAYVIEHRDGLVLFDTGHVPGVGSRRRLREATAMINAMRQRNPGLVILPAHDPGAASRLAQATGQAPRLATA